MRIAALVCVLAACGGGTEEPTTAQFVGAKAYAFGPFELAPGIEVNDSCVQISLDNETYANVNVVELTTGKGFHHSNWFYVPDFQFPGADGTFDCDERGFDQAVAAIKGGV
ncbi:MAG TPA: hypothetical protein VK427_20245, partial [Kofleriaceae bacterium]|nr:hypothetical protein [Kofleriaceae bacterium]